MCPSYPLLPWGPGCYSIVCYSHCLWSLILREPCLPQVLLLGRLALHPAFKNISGPLVGFLITQPTAVPSM